MDFSSGIQAAMLEVLSGQCFAKDCRSMQAWVVILNN